MTESNGTTPDAKKPAPDWRSAAASWAVTVGLVGMSFARWKPFVYPNYAGAIILQCGALLLVALALWPARSMPRWRAGWGMALLVLYAILAGASFLHAATPGLATIGSVQVIFPVVWALALGALLRRPRDLRILLAGIIQAGTVAAVVGLYFVVSFRMRTDWPLQRVLDSIQHVFGHRNFLAVFLLPALLLCLAELVPGLLTRGAVKRGALGLPKPLLILHALVMLCVLALCTSAGALLGIAAGVGVLMGARMSPRWRRIAMVCIIIVGLVGLIVFAQPSVEARTVKMEKGQRWFMWKGVARMAAEHPVLGWGTGAFMPNFSLYKPHAPMKYDRLTQLTLHPHNELLLVVIEVGIVGLLAYLAGLWQAVRSALRASEGDVDPVWRLMTWAVLAGFAAMFAQSLVTVSLRYWAPMAMFWTLVGILLALPHILKPGQPVRAPNQRVMVRGVLFGVAVLAIFVVVDSVVVPGARAEWLLGGGMRKVAARARTERVSREVHLGERLMILERARALSRYVPDYFVALRGAGDARRRVGDIRGAVTAYEELDRQAPGYPPVRRLIAGLCLKQYRAAPTAPDAAEWLEKTHAWLAKALAQNPYDPIALLATAEACMVDPAKAESALDYFARVVEAPVDEKFDPVRMRAIHLLHQRKWRDAARAADLKLKLRVGVVKPRRD